MREGNNLAKVKISGERCKSCGLCVRECPRDAISISEVTNAKGYKVVQIDDEKCIACGICYHMCPDSVFEVGVE